MKRESQKYHEYQNGSDKAITPSIKNPAAPKPKEFTIDESHTLKHILTDNTESTSLPSSETTLAQSNIKFKNETDGQLYESMAGRLTTKQATMDQQRREIRVRVRLCRSWRSRLLRSVLKMPF